MVIDSWVFRCFFVWFIRYSIFYGEFLVLFVGGFLFEKNFNDIEKCFYEN